MSNNKNRGSAAEEKPLISFKLGAIIVGVVIVVLMVFQWNLDRQGTNFESVCGDAALRQGVEVEVTDSQPFVNDEMYVEKDEYNAEAKVSNGTQTYLVEMQCTIRYTNDTKENVDSVELYFK